LSFDIDDKTKEDMVNLSITDIDKIEIGPWGHLMSGVVFAGYGEKEIFPSTIDFILFGKIGKNILRNNIGIESISSDLTSQIIPYGQPNVIKSFIKGMDPDFNDMINYELDKLIENAENMTGKKNNEKYVSAIKELKEKIDSYEYDNFISPIFDIVQSLPKSNLAEMAEALVNLTGLRQHVSTEQQTVGGQTDVALITKTDGFVWIKKKHIFHIENEGQ